MQRISITNPQNIIDGTAKKYYFKLRNTGGPKGDKGDKGDTGATGPQGPQGNAATVSVGSTTTLPVGQDATVENVGTQYNAVLNFGIPQGPRGPQGIQGERGEPGQTGQTGPRGPQGERGTNATVYVGTTTTTNPGTQARVYNSGTDSNAVLNFEIPRGDVGPQPELVQSTGTSTTKAMSQNATTVALNGKQNKLTAGANIQIENGTISATDTTYTAGNGLNLNGTEFSADTDVLATKEDLEGYYTKTETDNLLAPKLEAEVVTELPTTGEDGKLYLTPKAHTTQTATGNPITATITEQAGKIESFQLDGDTYQKTYTGKNLVATTRTAPQTQNGVTCTWDGASFTLDGTSTARVDFYGRGWWGATSDPIALPAGTYSMSLRKSDGSLATDADFSVDCYYGTTHIIGIYRGNSGTGFRTETFDSDTQYTVFYISLGSGRTYNNEKFYVQLEKSESPTAYEPFVGGQAIPNPDYPQAIQTVTGEQTVTVEGKNKIKSSTAGSITWSGTTVTYAGNQITINKSGNGGIGANAYTNTVYTPLSANQAYTFSMSYKSGEINTEGSRIWDFYIYAVKADGSTSNTNRWTASIHLDAANLSASATFTPSEDFVGYKLGCYIPSGSSTTTGDVVFNAQLELGSTATAYAPYSEHTYQLDLGTIELCKLGAYQDYIYKDGDDWKIRKNTNRFTFEEKMVVGLTKQPLGFVYNIDNNPLVGKHIPLVGECSHFDVEPTTTTWTALNKVGMNAVGALWFRTAGTNQGDTRTIDEFGQWLVDAGVSFVYALATPTDTVITDTDLIAQLEAIRTASLQNGANTITNTATGTNLAGDMEIGYYGYNPTNRYDKFIWLDLNNAYEQLNNPDTSSTLSTLSTRSLGATTEQPTVTRSLETETITLKKGETEPTEDKTELPTILDEEAEETETTEPEESDGTDER